MPKRILSCLVVMTALQISAVPQSRAQDSMDFGADDESMDFGADDVEAEAPPEASGEYADMLQEAKSLYDAKKNDEASLMFYRIIESDDPGAEGARGEAEYNLGKALLRLDLYQGALSYFGRIVDEGDTHPYYMPAMRGLILLTDAIPSDPSLMERLQDYASYFPESVPEEYRDQFAYLVGRHLYQQMDTEEALRLLRAVSRRSDYFDRARYLAGITYVASYQAKPAIEEFKEVLRHLERKEEEKTLTGRERELLELTRLAMARTFYSTGDYETSLKYYSRIKRRSKFWPQTLFESSWAYFQTDDYNKALGNLHSLNSPFFADAYFPEGPILSAVIYIYNCKYDRVRDVLSDFEYYYSPLAGQIQEVISKYQDPTEMYEWIQSLQQGDVDFDPQVYQILDAAVNDAEVQSKFELVETVKAETAKIETMPDAWKSSSLGDSLVQESQLALSFAQNNAGSLATQRLERVVHELNELGVQKDEITYEVARAEQGQIEAELRAGMSVAQDVTTASKIKVTDEQMYWTFDGEYWRDELGAYVFNMNSECSR